MSYKYRFIVAFLTLELFFIFLIIAVNFFTIEKNSDKYVKEKIQSTKVLITKLIQAPMSVYDLATLDNIVHESIERIKDIKYILIVDKQNRVLSTNISKDKIDELNDNKQKHINLKDKNLVTIEQNIYYDDILLGHIHLVFDISDDINSIEQNKNITFFIILLQIFISTALAYFIGKKLTNSLLSLANVASNIGKDKFSFVPYLQKKDEIGFLAKSMNKMQEEINTRNAELKLFFKLFENSLESIAITNPQGIILNVNSAFCEVSGYKREEVLGNSISILKSGKHTHSFYSKIWRDILKKGFFRGEVINRKKDGNLFVCILNISVIKNEKEEITNFISLATDITEYKRNEEIIRHQSKLATMGEMLNNIAHQWRQPLSTITSASSGLIIQSQMKILDDESLEKSLKSVIKASDYLSHTIDDFRGFFKKDNKVTTFSLKQLIDDNHTIIDTALKNNYVKLILDVDEKIRLTTFKNELMQVLMNIIYNSNDVLKENLTQDKYIFITGKIKDDICQLIIRDNGGGVDIKIIEKIFEPYFTTKHQSQGTGIGLYMSHTIIHENMGGKIYAQNCEFEFENKKFSGLDIIIEVPIDISIKG